MKTMTEILRRLQLRLVNQLPERKFVLVLSIIVGFISGLAAITLKNSIHFAIHHLTKDFDVEGGNFLYLAYPMIGIMITVLLIKFVIKEDIGHGVSKILFAFSKKNSKLSRHNMYSSMITSTITIGFGGSVGAEAPVVLTGASIGSNLAQYLRLNYKSIILLTGCGSAAAVAGIFNAPLAGLLFTIEVLMLDLTMASLLPLLLSAVTATVTSHFLMGKDTHFRFEVVNDFAVANVPWIIILGVVAGLVSLYFSQMLKWTEARFKKITNIYTRVLIGGVVLSTLIFLLPALWGEGYISINAILGGRGIEIFENSPFYQLQDDQILMIIVLCATLALKVFATAATTGAGGIGGIFAPSLFMGCFTGYIFTLILSSCGTDLPSENFALYGMAGLMAGVMHAPMTAVFLIAEITGGYALFVPLLITSAIAYLTIKSFEKHSIYHVHLAERGELLTHDKDKNVLTLLKLKKVIETDLQTVHHDANLAELVKVISKSKRNIFPVIDDKGNLKGIVLLDNIRSIMFNKDMYEKTYVTDLMVAPPDIVHSEEKMEVVMRKFKKTGAWNLPVVDDGKYVGFISKATIFNAYRNVLVHYTTE